jgi:hypothetical protein
MKQQLLSFFAGFFLVLAIAGIKHYGFNLAPHGQAVAAAGNYVAVINDTPAQRTFLAKKFNASADNLLSAMGRDVQSVLREPELVRQDRPTVIWQYRSDSCVLDIYFATEDEDPLFAPVVHYEIRSREAEKMTEDQEKSCLRSLIRQRALSSAI